MRVIDGGARATERWWHRLSDGQRAWLRWLLPLLAWGLLMAILWEWHRREGRATGDEARDLFIRVGWVCALCFVAILLGTRRWSFLILGLFSLLVGFAGLLVRVIGRTGPTPAEWERDLIQSALEAGAGILALGLLIWLVVSRFGTRGSGDPTRRD